MIVIIVVIVSISIADQLQLVSYCGQNSCCICNIICQSKIIYLACSGLGIHSMAMGQHKKR